MQHIKITTDFDITNTGIVRNFNKNVLPAKAIGRVIFTKEEWQRCRRQQTNWETIIQLISLRTQPLNIKTVATESEWVLEFDVEFNNVLFKNGDPVGLLKEDFDKVPLLVGLAEHSKDDEYEFIAIGKNLNIDAYEIQEL